MIETNWSVITGGPSSGKTTLIRELEAQGHAVRHEVARSYIEQMMQNMHLTAEQVRQQTPYLQRQILALKLNRERHTQTNQPVFFDRGTPDSLAYFRYHHLNLDDAIRACTYFRYRHIFFCEPLPFEYDGLRTENQEIACQLSQEILQAYRDMQYSITVLPTVSISERLQLILAQLCVAPK